MTKKARPQRPKSVGRKEPAPGAIAITKADAALGQLETAIDLYFGNGNLAAIHTLAAAAEEIFAALCKHAGKPVIDLAALAEPDVRGEVENALRQSRRFFKHASRDPLEKTFFHPKENEFLLILACDMARSCLGYTTKKLLGFRVWFLLRNPQVMVDSEAARTMAAKIRAASVSIDDSDRAEFYQLIMAMPLNLDQNLDSTQPA